VESVVMCNIWELLYVIFGLMFLPLFGFVQLDFILDSLCRAESVKNCL